MNIVHCYVLQFQLHCFFCFFSPFLFLFFVLYCHFLWLVAPLLLMLLLGGIVHPFVQCCSLSSSLTLLFHFDAFSYSYSKILLWSMTFDLLFWKIINWPKKSVTFRTKVLPNMFCFHLFMLPFSFLETLSQRHPLCNTNMLCSFCNLRCHLHFHKMHANNMP